MNKIHGQSSDAGFESFLGLIGNGGFAKVRRCGFDGKFYDFTLTAQQQAACPTWDTEKDPNPPIPAAKALAKANEFIASFKTKYDLSWELEEIALVKSEGWMWQARYRLAKKWGPMSGAWPEMVCWILMDGTVVQPRITEDMKLSNI